MIDQPAPKHVFMSYSRKDEAVMRLITEFLRKQGINVWVDNEKLVPGTPIWEVEIEKAIRAAGAVVVLLSPYSNASIWVRREISFAERYSKRIFPLLIDGDEDTSIMLRLSTSQYVDIRENEDVGLNSLRAALSFYLEDLENQEIKARKEAERLARKKAEQEAAKRDAKGKASKQKAEREAAEKAAQEKAEKEAKEKAEREAAEKAAREKAAKEKAEREATEKAAREKAEREAAEKAAREKAEREADEKAKRKKAELRAAKWKAYNPRIFFPKLQSFFDIQLRDKGRIILSSWQSLEEISWPRISKAIRIFLITYIIAEFLLIAFDIGKINTDTTSLKFYDISWFWIVIEIVIGVVMGISLGIYDEDAEEAYDEEAIYEADIPIWVQIVSFIWGSIGFLIWGFCTISFSFLFLGKFNLGDNVYVGLWLLSLVPAIFLGIDGGWRWWNGARKYFIT